MSKTDALDRREFLKLGTAAVTATAAGRGAASATAPVGVLAAPPIPLVRIGMVGIGLQGGSHLENFLKIDGCRVTAVCDVREARTTWATQAITAAGSGCAAALDAERWLAALESATEPVAATA